LSLSFELPAIQFSAKYRTFLFFLVNLVVACQTRMELIKKFGFSVTIKHVLVHDFVSLQTWDLLRQSTVRMLVYRKNGRFITISCICIRDI